MKFKKDEEFRKLPPFHEIHSVVHSDEPLGIHRPLPLLVPEEFFALRKASYRGFPTYAAVCEGKLWIYPLPERTVEIRVRYTPPMKEI